RRLHPPGRGPPVLHPVSSGAGVGDYLASSRGPSVDLVCPLDFRYGRKEMKALWTEEARLRYLLTVEAALAHAHAETGTIPKDAAKRLQKVADSGKVKPDRVKEIEAEIKHDLMAVVKAMTE